MGLPAGRHRCRCPAPCDLVPGCSSYRSEPRFLGGWQGESEEAAHHTTPPKQGESTVQTHPPRRPSQFSGSCWHYGIHPPTTTREGEKPPQPHANREAADSRTNLALCSAQVHHYPRALHPCVCWHRLVDGRVKGLHQPKARNLRAPQQRL